MKLYWASGLLLISMSVNAADSYAPAEIRVRVQGDPASSSQILPLSKVDPQGRLLEVRVRFVLPDAASLQRQPMGLYVAGPAAYEAWWNGAYIGRNGKPGQSRAQEIPGRIDSALPVPANLLRPGENDALFRMSSFHLPARMSVPMQVIELRKLEITPIESLRQDPFRTMAAGALLLGAVYFGVLFLSNRRERSALLLTLLSLAVLGQLTMESIRTFVSYLYPFHFVRLSLMVVFAAAAMLLLVAYVAYRYAPRYVWGLLGCIALLEITCIAVVSDFQIKILAVLMAGFLVASIASAIGWRRRIPGAGIATLAVIAALILADVDLSQFVDRTYYVVVVGLLLLLFGQHIVMLRREQRVQMHTQLRATQLELELLRQQIQPHFLMNTLTALCEWVESDPAVGMRMIEALGDELRAISVMGEAATVPLGQEIDLCRHHLRVMSFRRDRSFTLKVQAVGLDAPVPPALFHTLIENSLTHNTHAGGAEFILSESDGADGRRRYQLRSPLNATLPSKGTGKGHAYVRARLQHAFGEDWRFAFGPVADCEWVDDIEVPGK